MWTTVKTTGLRPLAMWLRRQISARIVNETIVEVWKGTENSIPLRFPSVWLRDNCKCETCFHVTSQSRQLNWDRFETTVRPLGIQTDNGQLKIQWSDAHKSSYTWEWLRRRNFDAKEQKEYLDTCYRPQTHHWAGVDFEKIVQRFHYADVMKDDVALRDWLTALAVYGVAMIVGAPIEKGVVRLLAERVGFIRRTTYGEEFVVQAVPGAKNFAYLSTPLPLHTDLPYYEYKPSVNLLHCMVQTESQGGSNLLVDAYHIADKLREHHPMDFDRLTKTIVDWNDIGGENGRDFHNIWRAPVICLDQNGSGYQRVNHSVPQRDSHFNIALDEVLPWYESYARFVQMARADAHEFKTRPGDVLTFNNIRLLHGRTGYDDTEHNSRYIIGAYLDWDIIYSRLRVLNKQITKNSQ